MLPLIRFGLAGDCVYQRVCLVESKIISHWICKYITYPMNYYMIIMIIELLLDIYYGIFNIFEYPMIDDL
jgi:hypothetical protein